MLGILIEECYEYLCSLPNYSCGSIHVEFLIYTWYSTTNATRDLFWKTKCIPIRSLTSTICESILDRMEWRSLLARTRSKIGKYVVTYLTANASRSSTGPISSLEVRLFMLGLYKSRKPLNHKIAGRLMETCNTHFIGTNSQTPDF